MMMSNLVAVDSAFEGRPGMDMTGAVVIGLLAVVVAVYFTRHQDPLRRARFLRRTGFGFMALYVGFFGAFLVGETLVDPGGWRAIGLIAIWLVPLVGLCLVAWYLPDRAGWILSLFVAAIFGLSIWFAADPAAWRAFENRNGPVRAIIIFAVSAVLALWGLRRTLQAGLMLLIVGLVPVLLAGGGKGGMSSLAAAASPAFIAGLLYLAAGYLGRRQPPPAGMAPNRFPKAA